MCPTNRVGLDSPDFLAQHYQGEKTFVFGIHKSAPLYSAEDHNTCPNYRHFSPYGFCPYDCQYCYLAGTPWREILTNGKNLFELPKSSTTLIEWLCSLLNPLLFIQANFRVV